MENEEYCSYPIGDCVCAKKKKINKNNLNNLKETLNQLDRKLGGQIDHGIESDVYAISTAIYDILNYLIYKDAN